MSMTPAEHLYVLMLEDAVEDAKNTIVFLDGCLRHPETYAYCYPKHTLKTVNDLEKLVPSPPFCVHSKTMKDCESCDLRVKRYQLRSSLKELVEVQV